MIAWKSEGTRLYQALPKQMQTGAQICEPLTAPEAGRDIKMEAVYRTLAEYRPHEP